VKFNICSSPGLASARTAGQKQGTCMVPKYLT